MATLIAVGREALLDADGPSDWLNLTSDPDRYKRDAMRTPSTGQGG